MPDRLDPKKQSQGSSYRGRHVKGTSSGRKDTASQNRVQHESAEKKGVGGRPSVSGRGDAGRRSAASANGYQVVAGAQRMPQGGNRASAGQGQVHPRVPAGQRNASAGQGRRPAMGPHGDPSAQDSFLSGTSSFAVVRGDASGAASGNAAPRKLNPKASALDEVLRAERAQARKDASSRQDAGLAQQNAAGQTASKEMVTRFEKPGQLQVRPPVKKDIERKEPPLPLALRARHARASSIAYWDSIPYSEDEGDSLDLYIRGSHAKGRRGDQGQRGFSESGIRSRVASSSGSAAPYASGRLSSASAQGRPASWAGARTSAQRGREVPYETMPARKSAYDVREDSGSRASFEGRGEPAASQGHSLPHSSAAVAASSSSALPRSAAAEDAAAQRALQQERARKRAQQAEAERRAQGAALRGGDSSSAQTTNDLGKDPLGMRAAASRQAPDSSWAEERRATASGRDRFSSADATRAAAARVGASGYSAGQVPGTPQVSSAVALWRSVRNDLPSAMKQSATVSPDGNRISPDQAADRQSASSTAARSGGAGSAQAIAAGRVPVARASTSQASNPEANASDRAVGARSGVSAQKKTTAASAGASAAAAATAAQAAAIDAWVNSDAAAAEEARKLGKNFSVKKRKHPVLRVVLFSLAGVLVVSLACGSVARWVVSNDAEAIQGAWRIDDSEVMLVIDDSQIKLAEDIAYDYDLDTMAKTLHFSFGELEGDGRYRLAYDGQTLYLADGEGYSWWRTLVDDWPFRVRQFISKIAGKELEDPLLDAGGSKLIKVSDDASATPSTPKASNREDATWVEKIGSLASEVPTTQDIKDRDEAKKKAEEENANQNQNQQQYTYDQYGNLIDQYGNLVDQYGNPVYNDSSYGTGTYSDTGYYDSTGAGDMGNNGASAW